MIKRKDKDAVAIFGNLKTALKKMNMLSKI